MQVDLTDVEQDAIRWMIAAALEIDIRIPVYIKYTHEMSYECYQALQSIRKKIGEMDVTTNFGHDTAA